MSDQNLPDILRPFRTISIIGLGKNVGKTTTLNHITAGLGGLGYSLALTSIGRDGEETDVVTNTHKPRIFVAAGTIVITAQGLLASCDITLEILAVTGFNTAMGRVVIVKARSDGFVQLAGPSITAHMTEIINTLAQFNVDKIIIDGAISRKSLAAPDLVEAAVLCTGAAIASSLQGCVEETRHHLAMLTLPVESECQTDSIYLTGAVSDAAVLKLIMSSQGHELKGRHIVADHPGKIFITAATYEKLRLRQAVLAVRRPIRIAAVTVNPTSPRGYSHDPAEFLAVMRGGLDVPVFDVLIEQREENRKKGEGI